ncbi:MAG: PIG-L deacetylase family protein [Candidatus Thorarchaeota archaeon]
MIKIIFFQPHPDDLDFNCGHLLHHLATRSKKDYIIKIASITKGEFGLPGFKFDKFKGEFLARIRTNELYTALNIHNIDPKDVYFFNFVDGFVKFNRELIFKIKAYLIKERPDVIIAPEAIYTWYQHEDHTNVGKAIFYILYHKLITFTPKLYFYGSLNPNFYFGFIKKDFELINELLSCHKTQYWLINRMKLIYRFSTRRAGLKLKGWKYAERYRKVYLTEKKVKKNKPSILIKILTHWYSSMPWYKAKYPKNILNELQNQ